jgi:prepilin-type N-terminal cleavage/methylation domain-containing protein
MGGDQLVMNQKSKNKNGFALLELLIAMVILAFGALSLAQLMNLGIKLNVQTVDDTQAATLAQWKMEELTAIGYQFLSIGGSVDTDATVSGVDYFDDFNEPNSGVTYHRRWMIAPCGHSDMSDCSPGENYIQTPWYEISVRVTVNRMETIANTNPRQVTIKSQIVQPY